MMVLIVDAVLLLERGQTDKQKVTDATVLPTPASAEGEDTPLNESI